MSIFAPYAGGGADASDIHGLKTGAQHPANAPAAATTGTNAPSTVPATAGYSGLPSWPESFIMASFTKGMQPFRMP